MTIRHTYDVINECGDWYVTRDGEPIRNHLHRTENAAREAAKELATDNNLWCSVFDLEYPAAEALKDTPWPYGATCVNKGTDDNPKWVLTEPYRSDDDNTRVVNPDPTGYVQISVYTRELYERACSILGVDPRDDDDITADYCNGMDNHYIPDNSTPIDAVKIRLALRRSSGILIERVIDQNKRADQLEAAGLMLDSFTRDQYVQACGIMGREPLPDRNTMMLATIGLANGIGIAVIAPDIANDPITVNLALRRAAGIAKERSDETDDADASAGGEEKNTGDDVPDTTT